MSLATVDSLISQRDVFEQLLDALLVPGAVPDEVDPQPGVVAQLADLDRRDEAGSQHAALVELGQPHRVELVFSELENDLEGLGW
jgi:hypothetical protein